MLALVGNIGAAVVNALTSHSRLLDCSFSGTAIETEAIEAN